MEWIRIGDGRLKATLSPGDVSSLGFDLSGDGIDRETLEKILEKAGKEAGFRRDGKVVVKLFPSRDGGCELFLAKEAPAPHVYAFGTLGALIECCYQLSRMGDFSHAQALYSESERTYYLVFSGTDFPTVSEYGTEKRVKKDENLTEYGTFIAETDAVSRLALLR